MLPLAYYAIFSIKVCIQSLTQVTGTFLIILQNYVTIIRNYFFSSKYLDIFLWSSLYSLLVLVDMHNFEAFLPNQGTLSYCNV